MPTAATSLLAAFVCLNAAAGVRETPQQFLILQPPKPIVVDGRLDEWDMEASPFRIRAGGPPEFNRSWNTPVTHDADLSGVAALYWDETHLYIAGDMKDDHLMGVKPDSAGNQGPPGWECDSLMVAIASFRQDMKSNAPHSRHPFLALRYAPPGPNARGQLIPERRPGELDQKHDYWKLTPGSLWAVTETPDGYRVEAAVPWRDLDFTPFAGERFFLSFLAADRDPDKPLSQIGWGYGESPRNYPVFRLADRTDVLGLLTLAVEPLPLGRDLIVKAEIDAIRDTAVLHAVRLVDPQGRRAAESALDIAVPEGMTGARYVDFTSDAFGESGTYRVQLLARTAGSDAFILAEETVNAVAPDPPAPLVQTPPGQLQHPVPDRMYMDAHREERSGVRKHGFVTNRQGYAAFLLDQLEPYLREESERLIRARHSQGYGAAVQCVGMHALTGNQDFVRYARELVDLSLDELHAAHYYFQFQGLTLFRYLTWLRDPESPFAPPDAEARYRQILHAWAADPPDLMFSETGTHNRIWLRYSLLLCARRCAEEDGQPLDPRVIEYTDRHRVLLGDVGDSDDAAAGYHWVAMRFAMPIYFYDGDWEAFLANRGFRLAFDRYVEMISPSGACPQFGHSGGWPAIGDAVWFLELMSRITRDGRYRWSSHRIAEYVYNHMAQRSRQFHHTWQTLCNNFALAYAFADDDVAPKAPAAASRITWRHPVIPTPIEQLRQSPGTARQFLDPSRWIPDKVVFSGHWRPQHAWGLLDLLPAGGHTGKTPGNLIALTINDSALLAGQDYHRVSPQDLNCMWIEDLEGIAEEPHPLDTDVPLYVDDRAFTFVRVRTERYQQLPVTYVRDCLFYKRGFVMLKDRVRFHSRLKVRLGPCIQTRCLGPESGEHWFNTYYDQLCIAGLPPYYGGHAMRNPAWDLLVYFVPRPHRRHSVLDRYAESPYLCSPVRLRQTWSGMAHPGEEIVFTTLLLPHPPVRDPSQRIHPAPDSETREPWIEVLLDRDDATAVRVILQDNSVHKFENTAWILINDSGTVVEAGPLASDAQVAVVGKSHSGDIEHLVAAGGSVLRYRGEDRFEQARRPVPAPPEMPAALKEDLRKHGYDLP